MAPKTYPQQIADLKQEKEELLDTINSLNKQLEMVSELRDENSNLKEKLGQLSQTEHSDVVTLRAKLNDANQRANDEAAHARRVVNENTRLAHTGNCYHNQLEKLQHEQLAWVEKDNRIAELAAENNRLIESFNLFKRQAIDQVTQANNEASALSNELQQLRMGKRVMENAVEQMKEDSTAIQKQAEERIDFYAKLASEQSQKLVVANAAIERYRVVVNSLPDTKAQLEGILSTVPDAESTV
jgi:chromosome segregation ATPase